MPTLEEVIEVGGGKADGVTAGAHIRIRPEPHGIGTPRTFGGVFQVAAQGPKPQTDDGPDRRSLVSLAGVSCSSDNVATGLPERAFGLTIRCSVRSPGPVQSRGLLRSGQSIKDGLAPDQTQMSLE